MRTTLVTHVTAIKRYSVDVIVMQNTQLHGTQPAVSTRGALVSYYIMRTGVVGFGSYVYHTATFMTEK